MRTKSLLITVLLVMAVAVSACGSATVANPATARSIAVNGIGQVSLVPDVAYIYVGVHTEAGTAADAVAENNAQTTKVINALKSFGVDAKDIRTSNFSIWPIDKYDPMTGQPTGQKTYSVDNQVYITARDLSKLGELLDTVISAGANTVNSIQFDVADKTEALKEARAAAVKDAETQAKELADAAGVALGDIQTISFYDTQPVPYANTFGKGGGGGAAEAAAVPIQPGQLTLTVTVSMTYEIK
jgi:uncharacterized protein YggE